LEQRGSTQSERKAVDCYGAFDILIIGSNHIDRYAAVFALIFVGSASFIQPSYPQAKRPLAKVSQVVVSHLPEIKTAVKRPHISYGNGSCVAFVQAMGFNIHAGAAKNWPIVAVKLGYQVVSVPVVGSAMVTKESSRGTNSGHVALVIGVQLNDIIVKEQNYIGLGIVSIRTISKRSLVYRQSSFILPIEP
jgi:hypothetical protein